MHSLTNSYGFYPLHRISLQTLGLIVHQNTNFELKYWNVYKISRRKIQETNPGPEMSLGDIVAALRPDRVECIRVPCLGSSHTTIHFFIGSIDSKIKKIPPNRFKFPAKGGPFSDPNAAKISNRSEERSNLPSSKARIDRGPAGEIRWEKLQS